MSGAIVVDVGNSRIKWGRCEADQVRDSASLPPDEPGAWLAQWHAWQLRPDQPWRVSGVHPSRRDTLVRWLRERCDQVQVLTSYQQLPLQIQVETPENVGIDRLLNAVAANRRRPPHTAAVLVDAGSAVTVDYLDASGVFRGGTIFPGLQLMARALHAYTAMLPIVDMDTAAAPPGVTTVQAIQAGVSHAVLGGIERLITAYQRRFPAPLEIYLTGGDADRLPVETTHPVQRWPEMTLTGILHSFPAPN